jgi:DNA-binding NarL/FixJ family response regulator
MGSPAIRFALLTQQTALITIFETYSAMETDTEFAGAADGHGDELDSILATKPDLVILDADLPGGMVFNLASMIRNTLPSTITLYLVSDDTEEWIERCIEKQTRANDFQLPKSALFDKLRAHMKRMTGPVVPLEPQTVGASASNLRELRNKSHSRRSPSCLTKRQLDVLRQLALGHSVKEVASSMHLSPKSVDNHKYRIMQRLDIHDRVQLARYAIREGLVEP